MDTKSLTRYLSFLLLVLLLSACATGQVDEVTPTNTDQPTPAVESQDPGPDQEPTQEVAPTDDDGLQPTEKPKQDFSHLWVEYRDPKYGYGAALPAHWEVSPTPMQGYGGAMITRSYDDEYFFANSIKGGWIGGHPPEGVVKLDFVAFEGIPPEQGLEEAIREILGSDETMSVVLSVESTNFGANEAVLVTTARPDSLEDTFTSAAFRISPDKILLVAAYPNEALDSSDLNEILNSLVFDDSTPVVKPSTAPHPPLTVSSEITGQATATYPAAWYGFIASLPEEEPFDDKFVLLPEGTGEFGISGSTPEMEDQIRSLRDASDAGQYVHLWGVLYCNIDDYNNCQFSVERLEYGEQYTSASESIEKWVGRIKSTTFNGAASHVFELAEGFPVQYGIAASQDEALQGQIEALSDTGTLVKVWGDLLVGVPDVNGTRIEVRSIDPPVPGGSPSSAACDSGYLGSIEDMLEALDYNLEIGNYYPFSYMIGNPFVIGFWQSEGQALPREQAFAELQDHYFPSPEEVVNISDPALFPDLGDIQIESLWGPNVDVAASLYSQGWGPDGVGEAILVIAQCERKGSYGYYWYGMLYAGGGF